MTGWRDSDEAELLASLRAADAAVRTGDASARRRGSALALRAVLHFLLANEVIRKEHLTRPLSDVWAGLYDTHHGAAPTLFEREPEPDEQEPPKGRPTALLKDHFVAHTAFALEALTAGKRGTALAANWIATEARRLHLQAENGAPITAKQIMSWRQDIRRGKATGTALDQYEVLRAKYTHPLRAHSREHCEKLARIVLLNLANLASNAAPVTPRRVANTGKRPLSTGRP